MANSSAKLRADVVSRIKQWIDTGELKPGTQLSTERELCLRLGTQRLTIRRALASLEQDGIIRRLGPRTRVVSERTSSMDNSIVLINSMRHPAIMASSQMPGWVVNMSLGIAAAISDSHYNLILIHPERLSPMDLEKLIQGRPHGVVFPEHHAGYPGLEQWLQRLKETNIPIAVYGDDVPFNQYDRVVSDHVRGGYQLTQYLLSRGCRRPMMFFQIDDPSRYWVQQRHQGYEQAMRDAGLEPLPLVTYPNVSFVPSPSQEEKAHRQMLDAGRRYTESYLRDCLNSLPDGRFDAIMVASDGQLFPVGTACQSLGLKVGTDVLLTGYDNYWRDCWEFEVAPIIPAATVDKQNTEAGRMMVQLIHDRAAGNFTDPVKKLVIEPKLIPCQAEKPQPVLG